MTQYLPPYPAYKDSGTPWLGRIPEHWEVRRLGASVEGCINGTWGSDPDGISDLPCIRVADFDRNRLRVRMSKPTMRAIAPSERNRRLLKQGDLLLEKSGGGEQQLVGVVVLYDHPEAAVCSNFIARMPVMPGYDSVYLTFLHSYLYSIQLNLKSIKQTTGIQNLDAKSYLEENVAFPPLPEQRLIARYLDWADGRIRRLIRARQRQIKLLEEYKQALIHQAVTGQVDVRTGKPYPAYKDSGVGWLGKVPAHWEVRQVKSVFDCLNHRRIPLSGMERGRMKNRRYDYYGASGVIDKVDNYLFDDELILIAEDGANLVLRNLPLVIIARGRFWVNNHAHILKPKDVDIEFMAALLETIDYRPWISGAAQPKLTKNQLMNVDIAFPSCEEQIEISNYLRNQTSRLLSAISAIRRSIDLLREYRTRLIADVVTGKVDVREVAAQLPEEPPEDDAGDEEMVDVEAESDLLPELDSMPADVDDD